MEYFLCDCVYFRNDDVETYIGKLGKIFETPKHEKKVKVVWFFRPSEICNFLGDYEPRWNEIFFALVREAIVEKCNVVCASDDKRNPQATEQELRMADYIFYHSFDVGEHRILKNFANHIDGIKVEHFFNGLKDQKIIAPPILKQNVKADGLTVRDGKSSSSCPVVKETKKVAAGVGEQEHISNDTGTSKIPCSQVNDKAKKVRASADSSTADASNAQLHKKRKLLQEKEGAVSRKVGPQVALDRGVKTASKISSRPDADLVWHALNQRVDAKVIRNSTFSSPYYGKVLVIFKSKVAAESAISKLQKRCLKLGDGRPIVCRRVL
ncbi:protein ANTI-SILENCING 1 isoform X2 [Hevea brasiliensis]|uniref:protein ANTI-SILENCING 1 isoform X2 n=1 Tax=Hevea brasiliensis TaxID=3981 RepID=UPI0025DFE66F|nr:protein ANTI-SILENCING 1 isoform X2 [Hevea brasiliensis]